MSLRHAILGLLARQPSTGYELARMFDLSLRTTWHASHSQIYPELARLEGLGLVEVVGHGPRRSKTWAVTSQGQEELRRWLLEEDPDRSQRNESGVRLFLTLLLAPEDRRPAFERDLAYVEQQLVELEGLREQVRSGDGSEPFAPQIELGLRVNREIRNWLREQVEAAGGATTA
jgi:DNA-binding PadR family transcriptional regulator